MNRRDNGTIFCEPVDCGMKKVPVPVNSSRPKKDRGKTCEMVAAEQY